MISLPDFKEKQLLFVKADWGTPSHLRFYNDNIVFEKDKKVVNRVSVHKTFAVFISGDLSFTTNFLKQAKEHGVSIFFLKNNLEMYTGMMTTAEGHYVLRGKQYLLTPAAELEMAKKIVENKIRNQATLLKEKITPEEREVLVSELQDVLAKLHEAKKDQEVLGIEGNYSRTYFAEYYKEARWRRRAPRTKEDIVNVLMDIGYTFLFNFTDSLLRLHGFDTYKGVYHKQFFQRRSLACDIMEPFRVLIDKQIVKGYNLGQISEDDFDFVNGAFVLPFDKQSKYVQLFLQCLMDNKEDIFAFVHGFYRHIMDRKLNPFPIYEFK